MTRPPTAKERESGAGEVAVEQESYYRCGLCGNAAIPAFHFEGDTHYLFHLMFGGKVMTLTTGEVIYDRTS